MRKLASKAVKAAFYRIQEIVLGLRRQIAAHLAELDATAAVAVLMASVAN